jgi:signal transduction histidine kinase
VDEAGGDLTATPYSCDVDRTGTTERIARSTWGADLAVIAATLVWTMLVIGIDHGSGEGYSLPVAFLYAALGVAPLVLRRRAPWLCLLLVAAVSMAVPAETMFAPPTLVAVYTVATRHGRDRGVIAGLVGLASFVVHRLVFGGDLGAEEWVTIVSLIAFAVGAGLYARVRRSLLRGLEERGDLLTEQAVAEERLRIARELHDAVGHKVSLMVISAQALEARSTGIAREAGTSIADLGREAMNEMRATVSLMRPVDESADREPGPSLGELADLVDQTRRAGIGAELRIEGERRRYPVALELSAFRIVQEALTNVARHSGAGNATVRVHFAESGLAIEVTDDGRGLRGDPVPGHGLIGMRERAALFGGELEYGPVAGTGFRVAARLPAETSR